MVALVVAAAALGATGRAEAQATDQTRIVDSRAAVVRFSAGVYTLDESVGTATREISLIARTRPNAGPPLRSFSVTVSTQEHTASSGDDYGSYSRRITFRGRLGGNWVAAGNSYESEVRIAARIVNDHIDENDETFGLLLKPVADPTLTIGVAPADLAAASRCTSEGCESLVTIVDDDTRGVTIDQQGMLPVQEGGEEAYSVLLDSQPTDDVTVAPKVRDVTDANVAVSRALTFTSRNWDRPQTVIVTAEGDENRINGSAVVTHTVSGGDYGDNSVKAASVPVAERDRQADLVHSGDVTIEAQHPTALQGIDDIVFTVTRAVNQDSELEVPVTLSAGIIDADRLSHTVTIGANETSAELRVHTGTVDPAAFTGDVTATVGDGEQHDVPDHPTASVRVSVGTKLVTVRFNAVSYVLAEGGGAATGEIVLLARTEPGVPAPTGTFDVAVSSQAGTASAPDDYRALSRMLSFPGSPPAAWIADGDAFRAEVRVPLMIVDDSEAEVDETLRLVQEMTPGLPSTVKFAPARPEAQTCSSNRHCEAAVTILDDDNRSVVVSQADLTVDEGDTTAYTVVLTQEPTDDVTVTPAVRGAKNADITVPSPLTFTPQDWSNPKTVTVTAEADSNRANGSATIAHTVTGGDYEANGVTAPSVEVTEWDAEGRTVVTLVHVPDGTVIPDNSTLTVGETVTDGSTFLEGERVLFRLLFAAADGGRSQYGADVELSFSWKHNSPIVPISGRISRIVLGLYRADVWDSAVPILDDDVGNPDSTVVVRITGCRRNGCVIGEPSEISVTIADDDGGPEVAPPGPLATPGVLCPDRDHSSFDTGLKVIWEAPDFVGGAPIDGYEVRYRTRQFLDGELVKGEWQHWPHGVATTSTTISGLDAGVSYGVQVRAVNVNGPGKWSSEGTGVTGQLDQICDILDELAESQ